MERISRWVTWHGAALERRFIFVFLRAERQSMWRCIWRKLVLLQAVRQAVSHRTALCRRIHDVLHLMRLVMKHCTALGRLRGECLTFERGAAHLQGTLCCTLGGG